MANNDHLAILRQGVRAWNKWRNRNTSKLPKLGKVNMAGADLIEVNLSGVDLHGAILSEADLSDAHLDEVNLSGADLHGANLSGADLRGAILNKADLHGTYFNEADLSHAYLGWADLHSANLLEANLCGADLRGADLRRAVLYGTDFTNAKFGNTLLADVDLSIAKNLHLVIHLGPSSIGVDTLYKSNGNIPNEFLEGCGVPESMMTFAKSLVGTAIEYYSCFISYSMKDTAFARQLNDHMKRDNLQVWFAPEEMKSGQKIHEQLYEAIRYHDKLILVLSAASMSSTWVQTEIKRARKHERDEKRRKLFPISLVPFGEIQKWELFDGDEGRDLAQEIREYYIPDFSHWKDYDKFTVEFNKLLRDLRADK